MNEKRFTMKYSFEDEEYVFFVDGNPLTPSMVLKMLKEQQAEIDDLKEENEKLTKMLNANYKTNNELVQYIQMLESDNDE